MRLSRARRWNHGRLPGWPAAAVLLSLLSLGCRGPAPLTADTPLHLEDHLAAALIEGSALPATGPAASDSAPAPFGVRSVTIGERTHRALYMHTPARFSYRVRVPAHGRLDAHLGLLRDDVAVTFRVTVRSGDTEESLFYERYADAARWGERSVSLSQYAGQIVSLTLVADAEEPGAMALWGAPTVVGSAVAGERVSEVVWTDAGTSWQAYSTTAAEPLRGGPTWSRSDGPRGGRLYGLAADAERIVAVAEDGAVIETRDAGVTWHRVPHDREKWLDAAAPSPLSPWNPSRP